MKCLDKICDGEKVSEKFVTWKTGEMNRLTKFVSVRSGN
jgi:hypothetical protein